MHLKIQDDLKRISEFDPEMWSLLKEKKIFATGCTGFIGTWIMSSFLYVNRKYDLGASLVCLTRNKEKNKIKFPEIEFIEGKIENFDFPQGDFDYVIHGATEVAAFQAGDNSSSLLDVSFLGTKRITEFAKEKKVRKILFLSSGAAYGQQPIDTPFLIENAHLAPDVTNSKSSYGEAKRLGELLLFNEKTEATSARIFATCGPYLPTESQYAFSNFIESVILNQKISIQSNGKTTRSYLYIGDLTLWLWLLLLKGKNKNIYNVGSDEEISILDLAVKIKTILQKDSPIEVLGNEKEFGRYIPSNEKIRREFEIKDLISLDTGIKKSFEFLKDNYANAVRTK